MIVMVTQNVPPSLRGHISRYLIETANGVYIGQLSARVRDKLWEKCEAGRKDGVIFQAWSTNTEQGFALRIAGGNRCVVDWEGVLLMLEPGRLLTGAESRRVNGEV
ncbi:MAG: type I-E CRISPR-associated endoribonuclease Cas2e [Anaerolineaceae bacterium]|nr:type I-E CRISPR-associated endoribonuclease Cas2e [Anaerolineaceae bacterium]